MLVYLQSTLLSEYVFIMTLENSSYDENCKYGKTDTILLNVFVL